MMRERRATGCALAGRVVGVALVFLFGVAMAARADGVEVTPFVGYRFGGDFDGFGDPFDDDLELDEASSYGLIVDVPVTRSFQVEMLWSRQPTDLVFEERIFGEGATLTGLDVDYYHVGGLFQWAPGQVHLFVAGGLGVTRMSPDRPGFDDETRFSVSFGGGVKVFVARQVGMRFEGRLFDTLIDEGDEVFCDPFGCHHHDDELVQGELRAGLVLRF